MLLNGSAAATWESVSGSSYTLQSGIDAGGTTWSNVPGHTAEYAVDGCMTGADQAGSIESKYMSRSAGDWGSRLAPAVAMLMPVILPPVSSIHDIKKHHGS